MTVQYSTVQSDARRRGRESAHDENAFRGHTRPQISPSWAELRSTFLNISSKGEKGGLSGVAHTGITSDK